ncbi:MAG: NINE protein [Gemmatimonadales bacterium]|nr:NINE protein [Gemmatimonadales bacterium]NIN11816.1 NINE protein [Gemmatimonadales bacterium]NIN50366.1 NINE protein [Gemmatimonadales bacterium]NIP07830.1 NINE protein [Gemmatimonadales bacterium]NIR01908.1 NINE protein [Gemmatimonadales bacterium]
METTGISDRSRGVALILAGVLGPFGAHRFYTGKIATGVLMLGTFGGVGLWWLYDLILILGGSFRDADDRRLVRWWEPNPMAAAPNHLSPQFDAILDELDAVRDEVGDLSERVDFMERVLARVKEHEALPRGATEPPYSEK